MFETLSQLAEQTATRASRRQFLGKLGQGALTVAAAVGGMLALPTAAQAARGPRVRCCHYRCGLFGGSTMKRYVCREDGSACVPRFTIPRSGRGPDWVCTPIDDRLVVDCSRCGAS